MGRESADTLMGLLPPVGWADVATKLCATKFHGLVLKMLALVIALVPALVIPLITLT